MREGEGKKEDSAHGSRASDRINKGCKRDVAVQAIRLVAPARRYRGPIRHTHTLTHAHTHT